MKKLVKCRDGWLWVTVLKKPIKAATNWVAVGPEEPINLEWFVRPKKEQ